MLTPKFGDNGELTLMKGRLVAAGNEVDPSLYTRGETSSPTVSSLSMMVMLAAASHHDADIGAIDFPGAFLFATLGNHKYMRLGKDATTALVADCPAWRRYKQNHTTTIKQPVRCRQTVANFFSAWECHRIRLSSSPDRFEKPGIFVI
jgi:hypothetical protein